MDVRTSLRDVSEIGLPVRSTTLPLGAPPPPPPPELLISICCADDGVGAAAPAATPVVVTLEDLSSTSAPLLSLTLEVEPW